MGISAASLLMAAAAEKLWRQKEIQTSDLKKPTPRLLRLDSGPVDKPESFTDYVGELTYVQDLNSDP